MTIKQTRVGVEYCREARQITRHHHKRAYAALVLHGEYSEAGDSGRRWVSTGDVLIHGRFEGHQNAFGPRGADILNLPCPPGVKGNVGRVSDPDAIVRIAEADPREAMEAVLEHLLPGPSGQNDWPDLLAEALDKDEIRSLSSWADAMGLRPASLSRGFRLAYGTSPQRFRADRRAWRALEAITSDTRPLVELAFELGFADQAHMSREVATLSGLPPGQWRMGKEHCVQ